MDREKAEEALSNLCETIEATGGLVPNPRKKDFCKWVPAADEEWVDLASAYLLACEALGREPMTDAAEDK